jgi:hypothetical protein
MHLFNGHQQVYIMSSYSLLPSVQLRFKKTRLKQLFSFDFQITFERKGFRI